MVLTFGRACPDFGVGPNTLSPLTYPDFTLVLASKIYPQVCCLGICPALPDHTSLKCHEVPRRTSQLSPKVSATSSSPAAPHKEGRVLHS